MKYKNILLAKSLLLGAVALLFVQCNESDDKLETGGDIVITDSLPTTGVYEAEATDLVVTAGLRRLEVSWKAPADRKPAFYQVEWQGATSDRTLYTYTVDGLSLSLVNLYNTEYKVTVKAVSGDFLKSNGITASATPTADLDGPQNISNLQINAMASTVNFSWTNPEEEDFDHTVLKIQEQGVDTFLYALNLLSIINEQGFGQLKEGQEYTYSLQTFDYIGNASEELTGTFKTKYEQFLKKVDDEKKPLWTIAGFSSEEIGGDPGQAANAIDGKDDTFWHSIWNSGNFAPGVTTGTLPQYIIIDLQNEYTLSGVLLYRRNNNSNGPTSAKVEVTSDDPNTASANWIDLGTTKNLGGDKNNEGLACMLNQVAAARYIKITVLSSNNGFAQVREVDIKVLVDE